MKGELYRPYEVKERNLGRTEVGGGGRVAVGGVRVRTRVCGSPWGPCT